MEIYMNRIKLALLSLALFNAVSAFAQRDALIDHTDKWNLNTKFDVGFTDLAEESATLGGVSIAGLLNDTLGMGLHARGLADSTDGSSLLGPVERLDFWYGGLVLEYLLGSENVVYLSADLTLAYGEVESTFRSSDFYVAEPGLNLNINITETLMLGIGASYRDISSLSMAGVEDSDLSDVCYNVSLRFTQF